MEVGNWVKSNVEYGRRLVDSGIEGARSGSEEFLDGRPLAPFLGESVRDSLLPAAIGICVGLLIGFPMRRGRSKTPALAYGLLGGAIGLSAGLAYQSRHLGASVADGALKNIAKVRDEHWLTRHPIDYA